MLRRLRPISQAPSVGPPQPNSPFSLPVHSVFFSFSFLYFLLVIGPTFFPPVSVWVFFPPPPPTRVYLCLTQNPFRCPFSSFRGTLLTSLSLHFLPSNPRNYLSFPLASSANVSVSCVNGSSGLSPISCPNLTASPFSPFGFVSSCSLPS